MHKNEKPFNFSSFIPKWLLKCLIHKLLFFSVSPTPSTKKKRGRPPIDDYDQTFTTPKIMTVSGATQDDAYSNDAMSSSEHDLNIWDEDQSANEGAENTETEEPPLKVKKEVRAISLT